VVIRHGQGQHQTGEPPVYASGYLGYPLTAKGVQQAQRLAKDPLFKASLDSSQEPVFAASNMIRAVETMVNAAPGHPIIIQPLLREIGGMPNTEALKSWLDGRGVTADLGECYRQSDEHSQVTGCFQTFCSLPSLVDWFGSLNGDVIFVTSHGGLMMALDHVAYSPCSFFQTLLACSLGFCDHPENCEVREYRLLRSASCDSNWTLRRVSDGQSCNCFPHH